MPAQLTATRHQVEDGDAIEFCFRQGWTDGLPVVPPTADCVGAVLAGCTPDFMPVVVAAVEGIADPRWSYHGPGTSTAGAGVLMIVNGPIARELDVNAGDNLFGPGWRANLTIGRAVRLVMRNV